MKLLNNHAAQIQADQYAWAKEHADLQPELFEILEINTDKYPHQDVLTHTITGTPLDPSLVDEIAAGIDNRYPEMYEAVASNDAALKRMGETLDVSLNTILGTDHIELTDIAFLTVAATSALKRQEHIFDTSIIVNGMIKFLGVKTKDGVVPATELLSLAFNEVYLNIPTTVSGKQKMNIPRRVVTAYNNLLLDHGIERRLKHSHRLGRAVLMGAALPGTLYKQLDLSTYAPEDTNEEPIPEELRSKTKVMGRANRGMIRFMKHSLTTLATTHLEAGNITVTMSDIPLGITTDDKLDEAMSTLSAMQDQLDPAHHHVYDKHGNLPVIR